MATESKWAERFWSVVTLLTGIAGGSACVKVMVGSNAPPAPATPAVVRPAPATPMPCYQPSPPAKSTCGTPSK